MAKKRKKDELPTTLHEIKLNVRAPHNWEPEKVLALVNQILEFQLLHTGETPEDWEGPDHKLTDQLRFYKAEVFRSTPPTPRSAADDDFALQTGTRDISALIIQLSILQRRNARAVVVVSRDSEGNGFSPLFQVQPGQYNALDGYSGDVTDVPEGLQPNAVVLWPTN